MLVDYNIYIRVQQLHYFIQDQIGYSIDVLQLIAFQKTQPKKQVTRNTTTKVEH
jgi:hypothetical protein